MKQFDHEKLDVYQIATQFLLVSDQLSQSLPRGRAYISDQLRRASLSICLNIAEGAGEFSPGDKKCFYRMARRSATECAAILDGVRSLKLVEENEIFLAKSLLFRIVSMLVKMTKSSRSGTE